MPVIITAHTKPNMAFVKKIEPLIKWGVCKQKVSIVAVSQENHQLMNAYLPGCERQCHCINNGIDIDAFSTKEHELFTFINVARQDENKNQTAIMRCFAKLYSENKNLRLILLGNGPCHRQLRELAKELDVQSVVELPGAVSNVADYYAISDVYVQASHREAMPNALAEAMALGLPCVATDCPAGGSRFLIDDGKNGILIPVRDQKALVDAMLKVLSDDEMAKMLSNNARKIADELTPEKTYGAWEKFIIDVVNKR